MRPYAGCSKSRPGKSGEGNAGAKLMPHHVFDIRHLRGKGMRIASIANLFGVSEAQVSRIVHKKSWSHI